MVESFKIGMFFIRSRFDSGLITPLNIDPQTLYWELNNLIETN